jgi:hypothetical protein
MELRHLWYFVAVAEAGSLLVEPFSITLARCYRRLQRQPKLLAGPLIPPSHASRWAF